MKNETVEERSKRILSQMKAKYPDKSCYDLDRRGMHFVCEVEPVSEHPEYDKAVEVIILARPHKHLKMTQHYTVLSGVLKLHVGDKVIELKEGEKYTVEPGNIHWAESYEAWCEIYSTPGWTKEDHIRVD